MAAPRNRRHILVPGPPTAEEYKPRVRKIDVTKRALPPSHAKHGKALERANKRRDETGIEVHGAVPGLYVQFDSQPDAPLQVSRLIEMTVPDRPSSRLQKYRLTDAGGARLTTRRGDTP